MTSIEYRHRINIILGVCPTVSSECLTEAKERIYQAIDKYDIGAVDLHLFRRELMKMHALALTAKCAQSTLTKYANIARLTGQDVCLLLGYPQAFQVTSPTADSIMLCFGTRVFSGALCAERQASDGHCKDADARRIPTDGMESSFKKHKTDCVWVRGNAALNRLSGTTMFDIGRSLRLTYQIFCDMDPESNGWVTLRGLKRYMNQHTMPALPIATSLFNSADMKRQGHITFKDLMHALYPSCFRHELEQMVNIARPGHRNNTETKLNSTLLEDVEDIFKVFDDNGDSTLDLEEFSSAVRSLGIATNSEAERTFYEIDEDASGLISLDDFVKWCHKSDLSMHSSHLN